MVLTSALALACAAPALADQSYKVSGKDTFTVGGSDAKSEISYSGDESLRTRRQKAAIVYTATVRYVRIDQGATSHARASYSASISSSGEQRTLDDSDPDYLTVLNQPFAAALDAATLRDLAHLHGDVPFDFPSHITSSSLHGRLRTIGEGIVSGARALGVSFDAAGPMSGALPDRPQMSLNGKIRMRGEAYYRSEDALLIMLEATLTISGNLANPDQTEPVTIVYRRVIRAARGRPTHAGH